MSYQLVAATFLFGIGVARADFKRKFALCRTMSRQIDDQEAKLTQIRTDRVAGTDLNGKSTQCCTISRQIDNLEEGLTELHWNRVVTTDLNRIST